MLAGRLAAGPNADFPAAIAVILAVRLRVYTGKWLVELLGNILRGRKVCPSFSLFSLRLARAWTYEREVEENPSTKR